MSISRVTRTWVEKVVLPRLATLTPADMQTLKKVLGCFAEDAEEAVFGKVLDAAFDGRDEAAQGRLRAFRSRLADAGREMGFALAADSRKKSHPDDRRLWLDARTRFLEAQQLDALTGLVAAHNENQYVPAKAVRRENGKRVVKLAFVGAHGQDALRDSLVAGLLNDLKPSKDFAYEELLAYEPEFFASDDEARLALAAADLAVILLSPALLIDAKAMAHLGLLEPHALKIPMQLEPTNPDRQDHGLINAKHSIWQEEPWSQVQGAAKLAGAAREIEAALDRWLEAPLPPDQPLEDEKGDAGRPERPEGRKPFLRPRAGHLPGGLPDAGNLEDLHRRLGEPVDALETLLAWLKGDGARYLMVLGEYGIGKTTLLQHFTRDQLERAEADEKTPFAIYLDLRYSVKKGASGGAPELDEIIGSVLRRSWQSPAASAVSPEKVLHWVREQGATLIFDGLDEVLVHLGVQEGQAFIRELWRALPPAVLKVPEARAKAGRLVFSCRSSYFATLRDQAALLVGEDREGLTRESYTALIMLPFDVEQVQEYLEKALGGAEAERALEVISSIHNLTELSKRPYLLSLIVPEIGRLEALRAEGRSVSSVDLYEGFVQRWLLRDQGKHVLAPEDKRVLMEDLAHAMWAAGAKEWKWAQLRKWLREKAAADVALRSIHLGSKDAAEMLEEDFRTATFVLRPDGSDDGFRFAHTSLQEFFLACALVRSLHEGTAAEVWAIGKPSDETFGFVGELLAKQPDLVEQLNPLLEQRCLLAGENTLAYWLIAMHKGLPEPSPARVDLTGADLFGWKVIAPEGRMLPLAGVRLDRADLRSSEWNRVDFSRGSFRRATGSYAVFTECVIVETNLEGFEFKGPIWRNSMRDDCDPKFNYSSWVRPSIGKDQAEAPGSSIGHSNWVNCCAISPDGTRIVTASSDRALIVWDRLTSREICCLRKHVNPVLSCSFSPCGNRIVSGSSDGIVIIWDAHSGAMVQELEMIASPVRSCAFVGDESMVVIRQDNSRIALIKLETNGRIRHFRGVRSAPGFSAISADGKFEASFDENWRLVVCETLSGKVIANPAVFGSTAASLAISRDGTQVVIGWKDGSASVWSSRFGRPARRLDAFSGAVTACCFSPDSTKILLGDSFGEVGLWKGDGQAVAVRARAHASLITSVGFSQDGDLAAVASTDSTCSLWDVDSWRILTQLRSSSVAIRSSSISSLDRSLLLWCSDRTFETLDGTSLAPASSSVMQYSKAISGGISLDGKRLVLALHDGSFGVWSTTSGQSLSSFRSERQLVQCLVTANQEFVVAMKRGGSLHVLNALSGQTVCALKGNFDVPLVSGLSPDGKMIAVSTSSDFHSVLSFWELQDGRLLRSTQPIKLQISSIALGPDGSTWIAGTMEGIVLNYSRGSISRLPWQFRNAGQVTCCSFSPKGSFIVACSANGELALWNAQTETLVATVFAHNGSVASCCFSADEGQMLTSSKDGTAVLWNTATVSPLARIHCFDNGVRALVDLTRQKFIHLAPDAWRYIHAIGTDPETGEKVVMFPEAALAPELRQEGA